MFKIVKGVPAEWGICFRTVPLDGTPWILSYENNTIAVGLYSEDIIILDAITGSQAAILSGHTDWVGSLAFSPGGTLLVSGSYDKTIKLWDMQTGGVVKTFYGHTGEIGSVSISPDCTRIASGSGDRTICLWDTQTGECKHIIKQQDAVSHVSFSPKDPECLISISDNKVQQWGINGNQIGPTYDGSHIAFSPDHTQFALCSGRAVTVQNSGSIKIVAKFHVTNDDDAYHCCFSPNNRLVAAAAGEIIYVWDIASSDPYLVGTFVGHTECVTSLVFSSSSCLISASHESVKFWQIGVLSADQVVTIPEPTPAASASIESISLQAGDGITISSNWNGVVKTWDILTGLCKASFQTPAKDNVWRDARVIDGKLILIWSKDGDMTHIWDVEKGELLQTLDTPTLRGLRISGDGLKIFCLDVGILQAWDMWTWKPMGKVKLEGNSCFLDSFCPGGSKIWVKFKDSSIQGWDFGTSNSSPVPLCKTLLERPHLDFIGSPPWWASGPPWIKDMVTGKKVFQLSGRYEKFSEVQWDGQYLAVGYESGEVLILDFNHLGSK